MQKRLARTYLVIVLCLLFLLSGCLGGTSSYRVSIDTVGEGDVVREPEQARYVKGTEVTLTAIPAENYRFAGWQDGASGEEKEVRLTVNRNLNVKAEFLPLDTDAFVSGVVVDHRGGPVVAGAEVRWADDYVTTTDVDGTFSLPIAAGITADVLITAPDGGRTRIQEVRAEVGETLFYDAPIRRPFHPGWSASPPVFRSTVQPGTVLSGLVPIQIATDAEIVWMSITLNGHHSGALEAVVSDSSEWNGTWDTTLYPNGSAFLRVIAYDTNDNTTMYHIPVVLDNPVGGEQRPGGIPYLQVVAKTVGENPKYLQLPHRQSRLEVGVPGVAERFEKVARLGKQALNPDSAIVVDLEWEAATLAEGYKVYRSFDGAGYEWFGDVTTTNVSDVSGLLQPGRPVWYKIIPYNRAGDGPAAGRSVTPLPAYRVHLEFPANRATDVPLDPTFVWRSEFAGEFPEQTEWFHWMDLRSVADGNLQEFDPRQLPRTLVDGVWSFAWEEAPLKPGHPYSWNIMFSEAEMMYSNDEFGRSYALSWSHVISGAASGLASFTTTTSFGGAQ